DAVHTGLRVEPVWADEREGHINDIAHWAPIASDATIAPEGGAA
ncbi:MAG: hypothetical protein JWM89_3871, partial [Acidimicrobiales bacterium]|nr:hypothetical protein [Acidimicrobiales bacterium]